MIFELRVNGRVVKRGGKNIWVEVKVFLKDRWGVEGMENMED